MPRRSRTRPPVKQMALEKKLRQQILTGKLAPGDRLPIRTELQIRHKVSAITIQRTLDYLVRSGFAVTRGSLGTFVADRPPHLYRYGLVLFARPGESGWSRFYDVIAERAMAMHRAGEVEFKIIYCSGGLSDPAHETLLLEAEEHGFAGLFFANDPWPIAGSPVLNLPVHRVMLSENPASSAVARISLDTQGLLDQAMAHMATCGRKRLAVLANLWHYPTESLLAMAGRHGLELAIHHIQRLVPQAAIAARGVVHLLCRSEPSTRPDALLICDDNYLQHAIDGILDAGLQPLSDIEVVGHGNFPDPASESLPLRRIGFDIGEVLRAAVAALTEQGRRPGAAIEVLVPAKFAPAHSDLEIVPTQPSRQSLENISRPHDNRNLPLKELKN